MVLHGFGSNMNAGNVLKPCAMLNELGYVTMRFDMPGCGESEGEKGRLICLEQVGAVSQALSLLAQHPARRAFPHRGSGLELRGRGRGLCGRGRSTHRGRDLGFGLGPWGAEIPRPASHPGSLRQVHRHAGGRPAPPGAHRHLPDGAALRDRADPGAYAWPRGAGLDPDVPGRDRAEHVRFPRRGGGGEDRAAPAPALAQRRNSVTPVEQSIGLFRHAGQPTELHLFADTDHFMFAESNTRVRRIVQDWLADYFPAGATAAA